MVKVIAGHRYSRIHSLEEEFGVLCIFMPVKATSQGDGGLQQLQPGRAVEAQFGDSFFDAEVVDICEDRVTVRYSYDGSTAILARHHVREKQTGTADAAHKAPSMLTLALIGPCAACDAAFLRIVDIVRSEAPGAHITVEEQLPVVPVGDKKEDQLQWNDGNTEMGNQQQWSNMEMKTWQDLPSKTWDEQHYEKCPPENQQSEQQPEQQQQQPQQHSKRENCRKKQRTEWWQSDFGSDDSKWHSGSSAQQEEKREHQATGWRDQCWDDSSSKKRDWETAWSGSQDADGAAHDSTHPRWELAEEQKWDETNSGWRESGHGRWQNHQQLQGDDSGNEDAWGEWQPPSSDTAEGISTSPSVRHDVDQQPRQQQEQQQEQQQPQQPQQPKQPKQPQQPKQPPPQHLLQAHPPLGPPPKVVLPAALCSNTETVHMCPAVEASRTSLEVYPKAVQLISKAAMPKKAIGTISKSAMPKPS
jgi:hypothetical protein